MPPASTVWSAKVGGRPIRPGVAERDAVLLPLEKGRAGEDAPTFVVELVYLQRIRRLDRQGHGAARAAGARPSGLAHRRRAASLAALPRGAAAGHVPRRGRSRTVRSGASRRDQVRGQGFGLSSSIGTGQEQDASKLQALVDRFRNEAGGRTVVGALPVHVTFPQFGPSMFLASELTAESNAPSIELAFKRRERNQFVGAGL